LPVMENQPIRVVYTFKKDVKKDSENLEWP
jgi:hypothetical protein